MKILLFCLMSISMLFGDEVQRLNDVLVDITKLKASHEECKQTMNLVKNSEVESGCREEEGKLKEYKLLLKQERIKTLKLDDFKTQLEELERELAIKKKVLKTKDKRIVSLKNRHKDREVKKVKTKERAKLTLNNICKIVVHKDDNPFPKLMMKKSYQDKKSEVQKVHTSKASSFRLKKDSYIYADFNNTIIYKWEKGRSFTSNRETLDWIMITGFFVDKKWKSAKNNMWIKKSDTIKR